VTVRQDGGTVFLEGDCDAGEAEMLLGLMQLHPKAGIDWSRCRSAHTAVVQVLLAAGRPLSGQPEGEFLRRWVAPAMVAGGGDDERAGAVLP
jgi:hypothetical protein